MESKVARIQQWLRDLRLPLLRSRSSTDLCSVLSEDYSEELRLDPERFEGLTLWNTNEDSTKIWKSSQNLYLERRDKRRSLNALYQPCRSQEVLYSGSESEESVPSSLYSLHLSTADSTQSLHELHNLQNKFMRTMELKLNSPRRRKRLSTSDPDFQFENAFNEQQEGAPQSTSGIDLLGKIKGYPHCDPQLLTQMQYQGKGPYMSQHLTHSKNLSYDANIIHDTYHPTRNPAGERFLHYSQNIEKHQHHHLLTPVISTISSENMCLYKTVRLSKVRYMKVVQSTGRKLPLTPQEMRYRQMYLKNSQRNARI